MKNAGGKRAVVVAGWAISVFFIGWAVVKMDLSKVWGALALADYRWIIPAFLTNVLILYVRALRWVHFVAPIKIVRSISAFSAISIGYMANMLLPARLGEIARAYVLARRENISNSASFGTVVMERAVDGLSMVAFILIVFMLIDLPNDGGEYFEPIKIAAITTAFVFLGVFACLYLFYKRVRPVEATLGWVTGLLPPRYAQMARDILKSFRSGFASIDHGHRIFKIVVWSAVAWLLSGPYNYFFFLAFGLQLPFLASYVVTMIQVFGIMIPSAPSFVGVYHAATVAGLALYGVDSELALSIALVAHVIYFFSFVIPGLIFLWMEQYSISDIQHAADDKE